MTVMADHRRGRCSGPNSAPAPGTINQRRSQATLELNSWIRDQFNAGTVDYVIDAYALLSCGRPEYLCPDYARPFKDGIHFGPAGHQKLGEALYERAFKDCR